jgi:methylmalonyl-CoA mutase C-terminal domain/subunit
VSLLSGAHMPIFTKIFELLDGPLHHRFSLVAGGVMPDEDVEKLLEMGVHAVVGQDTPPERIVEVVTEAANAAERDEDLASGEAAAR